MNPSGNPSPAEGSADANSTVAICQLCTSLEHKTSRCPRILCLKCARFCHAEIRCKSTVARAYGTEFPHGLDFPAIKNSFIEAYEGKFGMKIHLSTLTGPNRSPQMAVTFIVVNPSMVRAMRLEPFVENTMAIRGWLMKYLPTGYVVTSIQTIQVPSRYMLIRNRLFETNGGTAHGVVNRWYVLFELE